MKWHYLCLLCIQILWIFNCCLKTIIIQVWSKNSIKDWKLKLWIETKCFKNHINNTNTINNFKRYTYRWGNRSQDKYVTQPIYLLFIGLHKAWLMVLLAETFRNKWQLCLAVVLLLVNNYTHVLWKLGGTRWRSWLRHCATSRKVAGSIPDSVSGIFHWRKPSDRTVALGSTQPVTGITGIFSGG